VSSRCATIAISAVGSSGDRSRDACAHRLVVHRSLLVAPRPL